MGHSMDFQELQEIVSICIEEIVQLKEENKLLKEQLEGLQEKTASLVLLEKKMVKRVDNNHIIASRGLNNIKYELNDPKLDKSRWWFPNILSIESTIEQLVVERKSMARYGDGEFSIMNGEARQKFQTYSDRLSERLQEVIRVEDNDFLIAIADNYGSLEQYNVQGRQGIRNYMTDEVRSVHSYFLDENKVYHNAYVSRPYAIYADNETDAPKKRFDNLKRIWDKRKVIFVEGSLTRLGVGNDLFSNAAEVRRIEAPATNAFDKYDAILNAALKHAEEDTLFLIALGPTAGVLAYDLYKAGYQALDIGHVDLEYEWFLAGQGKRCEVKHKYNNEFPGGENVEDIEDEEYLSQVICWV